MITMLRQLSTRLIVNTCLRQAVRTELIVKPITFPLYENRFEFTPIRNKYVTSGVQGRRNSKTPPKKRFDEDEDEFVQENGGIEEKVVLGDRYISEVNFQFVLHSLKV